MHKYHNYVYNFIYIAQKEEKHTKLYIALYVIFYTVHTHIYKETTHDFHACVFISCISRPRLRIIYMSDIYILYLAEYFKAQCNKNAETMKICILDNLYYTHTHTHIYKALQIKAKHITYLCVALNCFSEFSIYLILLTIYILIDLVFTQQRTNHGRERMHCIIL